MQMLRRKRLATQINNTALALIAEARVATPREAKELQNLAIELDRIRVLMLSEQHQAQKITAWRRAQAA
jgi:hypothetical protein